MELFEVDPELFISCRLCLDEKGIYQIIPCVKDQIHYCFDITVEQYDGLPQLLCRKCKSILVNFYETKKKYKEKQDKLIETKAPKNLKKTKIQEEQNIENCAMTSEEVKNKFEGQNSQNCINHDKEIKSDTINNTEIVPGDDEYRETMNNTEHISRSCKDDKKDEKQESEETDVDIKTKSAPKTKKRKRTKRRILSFSSTSSDEFEPKLNEYIKKSYMASNKTAPKTPPKISPNTFQESNWLKRYICKYCNLICETKKSLLTHKMNHKQLIQQCNMITMHCKVTLQTFDEEPSFTNRDDIVALQNNKFLQDDNSLDYYVLYTSASAIIEFEQAINSSIISKKHKRYECSEVISSDEEYTGKSKLRKRIRLVSTTSPITSQVNTKKSEHSDIDDNNNSDSETIKHVKAEKSEDVTCINIDDTSTDASEQNSGPLELSNIQTNGNENKVNKKSKTKSLNDYKTIINIISICYNKHLKKMETNLSKEHHKRKESQNDRHKLLSIGRKVMSKWGITSLPLLKHLQQKDLKIVWILKPNYREKNAYSVGKESGYIHIQTITKNSDEDNLSGFQICNMSNENNGYSNIIPVPTLIFTNVKTASAPKRLPSSYVIPKITSKRDSILGPVIEADSQPSQPVSLIHQRNEDLPSTAIIKSNQASQEQPVVSQLLNANPVANPKQAPRKKVSSEVNVDKSKSEKAQISQNTDHDYEAFICLDSEDDEDVRNESENILPVITCTHSLLENNAIDKQLKSHEILSSNPELLKILNDLRKGDDTLTPRLKCKPVSELMATSASTNLQQKSSLTPDSSNPQQAHIFPVIPLSLTSNSLVNVSLQPSLTISESFVPVAIQSKSTSNSNQNSDQKSTLNPEEVADRNVLLLMHCPTLPNILTHSPFMYVRQLLGLHNITFTEINKKVTNEYVSLIKFKLSVKQDVRSILLYLSLYGHNREFALKVRDKYNEYINIETRPSFWEWEMLKAFQDDIVINKAVECAERVNSEFRQTTKLFLGLVKTIECKDPISHISQ